VDENQVRKIVVQELGVVLPKELAREKPLMTAAIMAQVTPKFEEVNTRVQEIHEQQMRMDSGLAGIYPRLDRQDKTLERIEDKIDRNVDAVGKVFAAQAAKTSQEQTEEKYNNRDKTLLKSIAGFATGGGLVGAWHWISTHLLGGK
jgi:hypothetical protein